jgi:hypothetical protein
MTKEKINKLKDNVVEILQIILALAIIGVFLNMGYMLMFRKSNLEQSHVTLLVQWLNGLFYLAALAGIWLYKSAIPNLLKVIQVIITKGNVSVNEEEK